MKTLTAAALIVALFPMNSFARLPDEDLAQIAKDKQARVEARDKTVFCADRSGLWYGGHSVVSCEDLSANKSFRSFVKKKWTLAKSDGKTCTFSIPGNSQTSLVCDLDASKEEVLKIVDGNKGINNSSKFPNFMRLFYKYNFVAKAETRDLSCSSSEIQTASIGEKFYKLTGEEKKLSTTVNFGADQSGAKDRFSCTVEVAGAGMSAMSELYDDQFVMVSGEAVRVSKANKELSYTYSIPGTENYLSIKCVGGSNKHNLSVDSVNEALSTIGVTISECHAADDQGSVESLGASQTGSDQ